MSELSVDCPAPLLQVLLLPPVSICIAFLLNVYQHSLLPNYSQLVNLLPAVASVVNYHSNHQSLFEGDPLSQQRQEVGRMASQALEESWLYFGMCMILTNTCSRGTELACVRSLLRERSQLTEMAEWRYSL